MQKKKMNRDRGLMRAILSLQRDKGPVSRFQELILPKRESKWCNVSENRTLQFRSGTLFL